MPDPNYSDRLSFNDVIDALDASPKPTILVIQQKWPPEIFRKAGLAGEIMTTSAQAVGCAGLLSNGPSRDVDAISKNRFQMLLGGVTPGHGAVGVMAVQIPVSVGEWMWRPCEVIQMDENGAVKFPGGNFRQVLTNAGALLDHGGNTCLLENLSVNRAMRTACQISRSCSASLVPRAYSSIGVFGCIES